VIAGVIEGFYSPSNAPMAMKFTLAAVLFPALLSYLFLAGRPEKKQVTADSAP
jgi:hypothetical protein